MTHEESSREALIHALRRELVGPDLPPYGTETGEGEKWTEVLQESPIQRYSAGVLFPQSQPINEVDDADDSSAADPSPEGADDDPPEIPVEEQGEEATRDARLSDQLADAYDETIRMANEFLPAAIGLSFISDYPHQGLIIQASAARYESHAPADPASKLREWHRIQLRAGPARTLGDYGRMGKLARWAGCL